MVRLGTHAASSASTLTRRIALLVPLLAIAAQLSAAADRVVLKEHRFHANFAPGSCVRLQADGDHSPTPVRVNGTLAGELGKELDISPFLRHNDWNHLDIHPARGSILHLALLVSPAVYIDTVAARGDFVTVTIRNTTENTVQVELELGGAGTQFTVSPGTFGIRTLALPKGVTGLRMTATSDGLDAHYRDEAEVLR